MLNVTFWRSEKFASKASYVYKILTLWIGVNFEFWPNKKGLITNFVPIKWVNIDPINMGEFWILSDKMGVLNFVPTKRGKFWNLSQQKGGNFEFWPNYVIKITNFPFLLGLFANVARFAHKLSRALERYILHIPNLLGHPVNIDPLTLLDLDRIQRKLYWVPCRYSLSEIG